MVIHICELDSKNKAFIEQMSKVFGIQLKAVPKILLVDTREEFDSLFGASEKTEKWLVAFTLKNNVVIFNKDTIEKETTHKKEEHSTLIKHELVHLFYYEKFKTHQPVWLNEGLCAYFSGQEKPDVEIGFNDLINLFHLQGFKGDKNAYAKSLKMVKQIFEKK